MGELTLAEYVLRANLGIDQLLFHPSMKITGDLHAAIGQWGRMSPLSALCFSALGVALLTLVAGGKRWRMPLAGTLA